MLEPSTLCQTKTHYTTLFLTTSKIKKINLQSFVTCLTATLRRAATESKTQVLASKLLDAVVGRSSTVIYPDGNHAWKSLAEQKGFKVEAVSHQQKQFTRELTNAKRHKPQLAGTQCIDRTWKSLKKDWLPQKIHSFDHVDGHRKLSRQLVQQVYQWVWRKHIGVKTPQDFLKELQKILKI